VNTLVIGYGNPLRGDDGAGWRAAELVSADRRAAGVTVLRCHQLTPELAEDLSAADLVVLVDASCDGASPGVITISAIGAVGTADHPKGPAWSHLLEPAGLVGLAERLYGHAPPAVLLRVAAANLEPGVGLSPEVSTAMPEVVGTVFGVIEAHERGSLAPGTTSAVGPAGGLRFSTRLPGQFELGGLDGPMSLQRRNRAGVECDRSPGGRRLGLGDKKVSGGIDDDLSDRDRRADEVDVIQ
jgi:hydrogenase maturation protease